MTIDEVIERLKSDAEEHQYNLQGYSMQMKNQIAKWLEELKRYRKDYAWAANRAYNKAVNDFEFACVKMIREEQDTRYGYLDGMDIREIAEKLKVGGKNERDS